MIGVPSLVCSRQGVTPIMRVSRTVRCYRRAWPVWMILSIWRAISVALRGWVWCGWLFYLRSHTALCSIRPMRAYSGCTVVLSSFSQTSRREESCCCRAGSWLYCKQLSLQRCLAETLECDEVPGCGSSVLCRLLQRGHWMSSASREWCWDS